LQPPRISAYFAIRFRRLRSDQIVSWALPWDTASQVHSTWLAKNSTRWEAGQWGATLQECLYDLPATDFCGSNRSWKYRNRNWGSR